MSKFRVRYTDISEEGDLEHRYQIAIEGTRKEIMNYFFFNGLLEVYADFQYGLNLVHKDE